MALCAALSFSRVDSSLIHGNICWLHFKFASLTYETSGNYWGQSEIRWLWRQMKVGRKFEPSEASGKRRRILMLSAAYGSQRISTDFHGSSESHKKNFAWIPRIHPTLIPLGASTRSLRIITIPDWSLYTFNVRLIIHPFCCSRSLKEFSFPLELSRVSGIEGGGKNLNLWDSLRLAKESPP